jgi:hypothetical protein
MKKTEKRTQSYRSFLTKAIARYLNRRGTPIEVGEKMFQFFLRAHTQHFPPFMISRHKSTEILAAIPSPSICIEPSRVAQD